MKHSISITFIIDGADPSIIDPHEVGEYLDALAAEDHRANGDEIKVSFVEAEWLNE